MRGDGGEVVELIVRLADDGEIETGIIELPARAVLRWPHSGT